MLKSIRTPLTGKADLPDHESPVTDSNEALAPPDSLAAEAVQHQLELILASPHFRNSKRYPALLRFVVERTLDGRGAEIKERSIAIDVFARDPAYDPSVDPVVRISAGEVRKRLAQYYQESGREYEIRIELPLGSYQPEFVPLPPRPLPLIQPPAPQPARIPRRLAILAVASLLLLAAILLIQIRLKPTALDQFWQPVVSPAGSTVMICFGGSLSRLPGESPGLNVGLRVPWWDAETLARLAGTVQSKGAALQLVREDEATFEDFQQVPAILIGAFNDAWTIRLMEKMRFTFQREGPLFWISDRNHPGTRRWKIDMSQTDSQGRPLLKEDFAVVSRVSNPRTGRITITVAGLYGYGTLAAGKFLTDATYLQKMSELAPARWQDRNLQVVIGTEVIQEKAGPPRILATEFW